MAQTAHCGAAKSGDAAAAQGYEKKRSALFAASEDEKKKLKDETAAYRLKDEKDRFAATSNAVEVSLSAATVGLVTKEEWARRRAALEGGGADTEVSSAPSEPTPKEKKKKKKEKTGGLSFAFDDEEGGDADEVLLQPKKKAKPPAPHEAATEATTTADAAEPAAPTAPAAAATAATTTPLPAGHTCIRAVGGALELNLEVRTSASQPRSRVVGVSAQTVVLDVKATASEELATVCGFVRSVLGGAAVACEIVRGHRAPVKTMKVMGVASADVAYHRLLLAQGFGKQ